MHIFFSVTDVVSESSQTMCSQSSYSLHTFYCIGYMILTPFLNTNFENLFYMLQECYLLTRDVFCHFMSIFVIVFLSIIYVAFMLSKNVLL